MPTTPLLGSQFVFRTFQEGQAKKLGEDVQLISQQLLAVLNNLARKEFFALIWEYRKQFKEDATCKFLCFFLLSKDHV